MDKETLSNYGWIVICVMVLAVMIALATPFGGFIRDAVWSTTNGLFDTGENALNVIKPVPTNLWNANWTYGKGISTTAGKEGTEFSYSWGCSSDFVDVKPGTTYALQCEFEFDINENKKLQVLYFTENKEYVVYEEFDFSHNDTWIFTVPENAALVRMMFSRNGGVESELKPIYTKLFDVANLQQCGYADAGKTLLGFGDSIAAAADSNTYSYVYQISSRNYMYAVNESLGGATIRVVDGRDDNILNQVKNADASLSPEYILINGMTNDAKALDDNTTIISHPELLGTISNGFEAELDTSTFCGAFEATIKMIKEKWPESKVIYVTTHVNAARSKNAQEKLTELAIQMCNKWDVAVADVYHDSGLDTFNSDMFATYIDNGSHPNSLGYEKFYVPIIEAKIKEVR